MSEKDHGNMGNTYAKKEVKKEAFMQIRCSSKEKALYVNFAQSKGITLAALVHKALNEHMQNSRGGT